MYVSMVKANQSDNSQKTKIEQATLVVIDKRNSDRRINEMDDALSIFDGTEDIDYSKMYPSTDDDKSENVFTERINIIWLS